MAKSFFLLAFCFCFFTTIGQKVEFGQSFPNEKWTDYVAAGAFGEHQYYLTQSGYPVQISVLKFDKNLNLVNSLVLPKKTKKNSFKYKEFHLVNDQLYVFYDDYNSRAEEVKLYVDQVDLTSMKQTKDNHVVITLKKEIYYLPLLQFHSLTWTANIRIKPINNGEDFMLIHDHHPAKNEGKLHMMTLDKDFKQLGEQSFELMRPDMYLIASFMEDKDQPVLVYVATEDLPESKDDEKRFEYSFVTLNGDQLDIKSPAKKEVHFVKTSVSQDIDGNIDLLGLYSAGKHKYSEGLYNVKFDVTTKEIVYETTSSIPQDLKEYEAEALYLKYNRRVNFSDGSFVLLFEDVNNKAVNNSSLADYYFDDIYIFCFDKNGSITNSFRIDKSQKIGLSEDYTDEAKLYGSTHIYVKNNQLHIYFIDSQYNYNSGAYDYRSPWIKGRRTALVHCVYDLSKNELVQRKVVLDDTQLSNFIPVITQAIELNISDHTQFLFKSKKEVKLGSVDHQP